MFLGFPSPAAGTTALSAFCRSFAEDTGSLGISCHFLPSPFAAFFRSDSTIHTAIPHNLPTALRTGERMASISKHKGGYRAQVYIKGVRASRVFRTQREAQAWAAATEAELSTSPADRHTLADLIDRYRRDVLPRKKGGDHEDRQAAALVRDFPDMASKTLAALDTPDLAAWRDARLKKVSDATILRQLNWMRHAFRLAREEWKWMAHNPLKGMTIPRQPTPRTRRVLPIEVLRLCRALGYRAGRTPQTKSQEVALAFLVALRSGMRAGEILSLGKHNLDLSKRVASVAHKTQHITGRPREVPLTLSAIRLLSTVAEKPRCFEISSATLDVLFRKARDRLMIEDLHFHDSRAEALTRLARKVDVLTLSKISGHKDLRILQNAYYRETAEQIAARLP